ncbi:GGDEF domain-containing protein [Frankia sp. B2]|uniref:diguanylate cyclase domain-containing protein n=1 Tax=Frankia sp. B2 TaxID=2541730 RepID=UPI00106CBF39|nr:GGDEF domain-containing protein [Frankia sp. B2]TFE35525.1 GGDEF domain-containing protein [Frankia sp. B2]
MTPPFRDLDAFRRVNFSFGYPIGDAVPGAATRRFSKILHPGDILGRWGGDEFVILTGPVTAAEAATLAELLISSLDGPLDVHGHRISMSVSAGVALSAGPSPTGQARSPEPALGLPIPADAAEVGDAMVELAGTEVMRTRATARTVGREHRPRDSP